MTTRTHTISDAAKARQAKYRNTTNGEFGEQPHAPAGVVADPTVLDDQALLDFTRDMGSIVAHRVGPHFGQYLTGIGGDADDYGQELAARMLEARARRNSDGAQIGETVGHHERKYGVMVAKFMGDIARTGRLRYEDRLGMSRLIARQQSLEETMRRALTGPEIDNLADQIREEFPARRRPSKGFQTRFREVAFSTSPDRDTIQEVVLLRVEDALRAEHDTHQMTGQDSEAFDLAEQVETKERNAADARKAVWHAMGAPSPVCGDINVVAATRLRRRMSELGGARAVAKRFLNGTSTEEDDRVLFAAWGNTVSLDEKDTIAEILVARAGYADDLYSTSISNATTPKKGAA